MQSKKILLILLFVIVLFISFFGFNKSVYAADVNSLENWVSDNEKNLYDTFINYDYIIVNNYYGKYVAIYYAPKDTVFEFFNDGPVSGSRRRLVSTTLENRDNHFAICILNPNEDNNFVLPTNILSLEELQNVYTYSDSSIINNFSKNNLFYNSNKYKIDDLEYTDTDPFWRPLAETLATAVETAEPGVVLTEILKIIPLILVILVSFLGFRKALRMLLTLLARS